MSASATFRETIVALKKKYRVCVIGSTGRGNYGHGLDTVWRQMSNTEIVAVSDDRKSGLEAAKKRLRVSAGFSDYRRMLDKVKCDIVAICPRWLDQHRDMALAAAHRGLHVYMEKPFCPTLEQCDQVVAACEKHKVKLAVAHPTRYSPMIKTIRTLIDQGKIGTVLEFRSRGKEDRRGGGEDLWVLGTHIMDMILAFGGKPTSCFGRVTDKGKPVTKANVRKASEGIGLLAGDSVTAVFQLPNGATAHFNSERNMSAGRPSRYGMQIQGSKGIIELIEGTMPPVMYLGDPSWSPGRSGRKWQSVSSAGINKPEKLKGPEYRARHILAIRDFIAAIEANKEPACGVYEARAGVEMISAVFESHRQRKPVNLPLKNRKSPLSLL